jgi:hypothetical protein
MCRRRMATPSNVRRERLLELGFRMMHKSLLPHQAGRRIERSEDLMQAEEEEEGEAVPLAALLVNCLIAGCHGIRQNLNSFEFSAIQ